MQFPCAIPISVAVNFFLPDLSIRYPITQIPYSYASIGFAC